MRRVRRSISALAAAAVLLPVVIAGAAPARAPQDAPSGPQDAPSGDPNGLGYHVFDDGHLPPSSKNVDMVGRLQLTTTTWGVGDVSALGDYAYLAAYRSECFNPGGPGGGVHAVSLAIPQLPLKVSFIPAGENTYVGEGVHAFRMKTKYFTGDVLLMANEPCNYSERANGGVSLWDVTDPANPMSLAIGVGDRKPKTHLTAHSSHSAQAWTVGKRAYVVMVDNHELGYRDVDILDITNPRKPKLIAETGLASWPKANRKQTPRLTSNNHHDMQVQKVNGHWYILVSYWDTGWVLLNVDNPKKPRFVRDSNFPKRDRITGGVPEGNAHQAVWTNDRKHIIGTTEDLFAKFSYLRMGSGNSSTGLRSVEIPGALSLGTPVGIAQGPTVYGGTACPPFSVPPASSAFANLKLGQRPIVVLQEGGGCSIGEKLHAADAAGYYLAVVATSHASTLFGADPERLSCPSIVESKPSIYGFCITHEGFHALMRSKEEYVDPGINEPKVGDRGAPLTAFSFFDGSWGNMRLLKAKTLKELDAFAIPESRDARYGTGYGALSVHEVKMDTRRSVNLAYASWYSGGLRVMKVAKGRLREVGHFIGPDGNNFWGTFPHRLGEDPQPYLLMSDVSYGLYVLRYTGPGQ